MSGAFDFDGLYNGWGWGWNPINWDTNLDRPELLIMSQISGPNSRTDFNNAANFCFHCGGQKLLKIYYLCVHM